MDYYEVVRLGNEETRHYICSICETEKKMFVSEETELRIIKHIQKSHAEKHQTRLTHAEGRYTRGNTSEEVQTVSVIR